MKKIKFTLLVLLFSSTAFAKPTGNISGSWNYSKADIHPDRTSVIQQVGLSPNNISTFFYNSGIFNQDRRVANSPGFEWPKGTGKFACFSSGLSILTKIEGVLKEAACLYLGEYSSGYINNSSSIPVAMTNSDFKIYKVSVGDNAGNNPDYANWYKMVPYGAPFDDVNHNGVYDNGIDKPGVKDAASTLFACLTDGFPESHAGNEGFGGGTAPVFCEVHFTAWAYNSIGVEDVQFMKWVVINKSNKAWDSTYFGLGADSDLGYPNDDYIGCDTIRNMGYCYNADNDDASYGANPPAFGMDILKSPVNRNVTPPVNLGMTAFVKIVNGSGIPPCERFPTDQFDAYNYLKGVKADGSYWIDPNTDQSTKYCYPGDPETNTGWTEFSGCVQNCAGGPIVPVHTPNTPGDRIFQISSGADNFRVLPNETQTIVAAQMIARGTSNLNSVTKLKQLSTLVQTIYDTDLLVSNISTNIPSSFSLYQNYPNPFNPSTKIKFDMIRNGFASLKIYDAAGKKVATLINDEMISAGTNEVTFDAKDLASGIYFYRLNSGTFTETKRMLLLK